MTKFSEHEIFNLIMDELVRQKELWGDNRYHPPLVWSAILCEETGEVAKAAMEIEFDEEDDRNYKEELVQVAAVAVAALVSLDRAPLKKTNE